METNAVDQRRRLVLDLESGHWSMTEVCERYGISRPTAYKWVGRYREAGDAGLEERSRAPHQCPHQIGSDVVALIVEARRKYGWGARKLLQLLQRRHPAYAWPAKSTVNDVLGRQQLLRRRRRRVRWQHPGASVGATTRPNQVWPADFKGQLRLGTGQYCYPLTVTDQFSRRLLVCRGLQSVRFAAAQPVFRALFRAVGLPEAIRTDNGAPFASLGIHGLSALNVWWMQLGIVHQRIRPSRPQDNGAHERMHRELKRETAIPPAATALAQQRRFDRFQRRYNEERPHEALGDATPASRWCPSPRPYPERRVPPEYPLAMEVRRVMAPGTFSWGGRAIFLSETLRGEDIGLEQVAEATWNIVYYRTLLARLDVRTNTLTGV